MPVGEAVSVFEHRRDAERGRRFDHETGAVEEQPHAGDDRLLLDQDGVVGDQEEVVQDVRDGTSSGDAVGDGVGRLGRDGAPPVPGARHRRRARRLDADHLDLGREGPEHMADPGGQCPAAERDQNGGP
ncbi:hypothetical protein BKA00_005180 [Actinomadura coerulea]|uniref:Uncharacterized protein n=1 Tax=Actinomadura coerulea TaxID=46159 RepID=A0A7X0L147_9ACTN|nr:hypothetical protein [Actinomadura coerulea]MBB6398266.1 hypothetical protein [Actinomadura coerulea]